MIELSDNQLRALIHAGGWTLRNTKPPAYRYLRADLAEAVGRLDRELLARGSEYGYSEFIREYPVPMED